MGKEKSLDKKKGTTQKVLLILESVVIAICMLISILVIIKPGGVNKEGSAKSAFYPVQSDSMSPSFERGALVFTRDPKDGEILDLGTIVTFIVYSSNSYLNTHRIVGYRYYDSEGKSQIEYYVKGKMESLSDFEKKYEKEGYKVVSYVTRGDKYTTLYGDETLTDFGFTKFASEESVEYYNDTPYLTFDRVVAVYKSHWNGVGHIVLWLMKPVNFFIIIMIPLILLFVYNVFEICRYIITERVKKQALASANAGGTLSKEREDEIARKAVEAYLAQQAAQNAENNKNENNDVGAENCADIDSDKNHKNED